MTETLKFSPKVEAALRELAGLPWGVDGGAVRCEKVCPVCAIVAAETLGVTALHVSVGLAISLGAPWLKRYGGDIVEAADLRNHPLRPRLLELLGVTHG